MTEQKRDTDRYRTGDDLVLIKMRQRATELARKIKTGPVTEQERKEYLMLLDSLVDQNRQAG